MATNPGIHKRVKDFLGRCLEKATKMEFLLCHINIAQKPTRIWSGKWDGIADAKDFASQILEEAINYCTVAGGGPQRYVVSAYDMDREDNGEFGSVPFMNTGFICEGNPAAFSEVISSEPPTSEGLMASLMRHNNMMFQQHNAAIHSLVSHLASSLQKKSEENERLMADRVGTITIMEDLLSRKHERDMDVRQQESSITRKNEIWTKLSELLPIAVNKLAGKELVRQKSTAFEATVMTFMESIQSGQLDTIAKSGIFSERQLVLFGTMLEQMVKQMTTADEKKEISETTQRAVTGDLSDLGAAAVSAVMGK